MKIFLLIFFSQFTLINAQSSDWVLKKDDDGVKVYTRSIPNSDNKEFKAITYTTKPLSFFEELIWDVKDYINWQENMTTAKTLLNVSPDKMYIQYTSDLPWPLSDRDVVFYVEKSNLVDGTVRFDFTCKPKYIKEDVDYLRLTESYGHWTFTPEVDDQIKIVYQFYGDPGGNIPTWIINLFLIKGPFNTLQNIR